MLCMLQSEMTVALRTRHEQLLRSIETRYLKENNYVLTFSFNINDAVAVRGNLFSSLAPQFSCSFTRGFWFNQIQNWF